MKKKILAFTTILTFSLFTLTCTSVKQVRVENIPAKPGVKILGLVTVSGEIIDFPKDRPGLLKKGSIQLSTTIKRVPMEFDSEDLDQNKTKIKGIVVGFNLKNGPYYRVIPGTFRDDGNKVFCQMLKREYVSIPLSEVALVKIRETNTEGTLMAVVGITFLVALGALASGMSLVGDWY